MKLLIAHISFIPLTQKKILTQEFKGKPIELAEIKLKENVLFIRTKTRYHVNLLFDNFILDTNGRLLGGKIGKDREMKLPKHDELGFHKDINRISPFVDFFWDSEDQFIFVEKNSSVFDDYEYVFNSIQTHLNKLLEPYDWAVFIEPITEKRDFWEAYTHFPLVYDISFELHMPNLFGGSQKDLSESLKGINKEFNATSVSQTLSNSEGKLSLNKKDSFIETVLNWIINGAGSWTISGRMTPQQKKETITSKKSATIKTEDLNVELENYSADEVKSIIQKVKPKIVAMRNPPPVASKKARVSKKSIERKAESKK